MVLLPVWGTGCETALKRGFREAVGVKAATEWTARSAPSASQFRSIRGLAVGEVTNTVGDTCPPEAVASVRPAVIEAFAELAEDYPGGEPVLTAHVTIQWYKARGALGTLVSPESWFVWLVEFQRSDGATPPPLLVVAHSEAARTSDADLAKACADALAKSLRKLKESDDSP